MWRRLTGADRVLLIGAAALIAGLYTSLWTNQTGGVGVEIWSRGHAVQIFPLSIDREIEVTGELGPSRIEIRDAQVRFLDSPCTNKVCLRSGWLHRHGDATACLPNGISLRVLGRDSRYDAINL